MARLRAALTLSPLKIAASYIAFGTAWILISDGIVYLVADSQRTVTQLQTIKGWVFVGISGVLIFGLTRVHKNQVESSRRHLETALQQLQVFYRIFRHDIRNNMNVVCGHIDLAHKRADQKTVESNLEKAHDSAEQIVEIGEKLNVGISACSNPTPNTRIDLVDVVESECNRFQSEHPAITLTTDIPDHAWIEADESMSHVIHELLENAMKHHDKPPDQRRITVSIEQNLRTVTVSVTDNGPGIPEEELEALRVQEETQLTHMSGVGLWLIDWLSEISGGDVEFETDSVAGTRVKIQLQRPPQAQPLVDGVLSQAKAI